jgi:hypothetical protein
VDSSNCDTTGTSGGTCTVTVTNSSPGIDVIHAKLVIAAGPTPNPPFPAQVTLTRETGDGVSTDSANGQKLWIKTHVINDATNTEITGPVTAPVTVHDTLNAAAAVNGDTVDFTLFQSANCTGTVVATDPGKPITAGVATSKSTLLNPSSTTQYSYLAHFNGDSTFPAADAACEPFTVTGIPTGQITPTQVDCTLFNSGTAPTLPGVFYSLTGSGKIGQGINPGVFFFWTHITTTTANQVVTVTQSNNSTNNAALFQVSQSWDRLYTGDCVSWTTGTLINNSSGASFTVKTPGDYIIGIKYDVKSIAGTTGPVPPNIKYTFSTSLGGTTGATVNLNKQ